MRGWLSTGALLAATAALASGCGGHSAAYKAQQADLAYETAIGKINKPFATAVTDPQRAQAALQRALRQYAALTPPPSLRPFHTRLVAALQRELRSIRDGLRAGKAGNAAALSAAERQNARGRADTQRTLSAITAFMNNCRAVATRC